MMKRMAVTGVLSAALGGVLLVTPTAMAANAGVSGAADWRDHHGKVQHVYWDGYGHGHKDGYGHGYGDGRMDEREEHERRKHEREDHERGKHEPREHDREEHERKKHERE
ncbi:hypothetical protein, partial [Thermomonospora echinospora]|uniref:hypothetical protein n=1 Tax=Thermomonospora echinospora TaxID=1992 RepID=UPI00190E914F